MRFISNKSAVLAWDERGDGPPLLLVMGHSFSSRMWHWALDGLAAEAGLIWFDNRGTGASNAPPGPYRMQDMAEDAFAVLSAAGLDSADVYGVSMGGMVALEMALMRPERVNSLILGCTAARYPGAKPPHPVRFLSYWLPRQLMIGLGKGVLYGSAAEPARIADDLALLRTDRSDRQGLIGQAHAMAGFDVLARLDEIRQPTLILHGSEDRVIPLALGQEIAAGIEGSDLVILEGAGHNYLADATEASTRAVLELLRSVA